MCRNSYSKGVLNNDLMKYETKECRTPGGCVILMVHTVLTRRLSITISSLESLIIFW